MKHKLLVAITISLAVAAWADETLAGEPRARPAGTGVIVHGDGYILTAYHVVSDARRIVVVTPGEERNPAFLVSIDEERDLALLKIDTTGLSEAPLGYAGDVRLDQPVLVTGFPFGLRDVSVTRGRVTAVRSKGTQRVFQVDAAINPGNSGGPLFNDRGQVVGIVMTKFSHPSGIPPEGMGFAIPISFATPLLANIPGFNFARIGRDGMPLHHGGQLAEQLARVTVRLETVRFMPPTIKSGEGLHVDKSTASEDHLPKEPPSVTAERPRPAADSITRVNTQLARLQEEELARLHEQGVHPPEGMVLIPAGQFLRGAEHGMPDARPMRRLYVSAFWVDQYEVTNARYRKCVEAGVCSPPKDEQGFNLPERAQHPVTNITWLQARTFCRWENRRLPTEAEWEKAARGTDGRRYPWGNDLEGILNRLEAHAKAINGSGALAVGSVPAGRSPYGVFDMAGNVWEWVNDWYAQDYYAEAPSRNPQGPVRGTFRVLRGGAWSLGHLELQTSFRGWDEMTYWGPTLGLRCAADASNSVAREGRAVGRR